MMAMRIDPLGGKSDLADILALLDIAGIASADDALAFVSKFYPEARTSGRVVLGLRDLWRRKDLLRQESGHAAPSYLGRSRAPPK